MMPLDLSELLRKYGAVANLDISRPRRLSTSPTKGILSVLAKVTKVSSQIPKMSAKIKDDLKSAIQAGHGIALPNE